MGKKLSQSKSQDIPPSAGIPKGLKEPIDGTNFRTHIFRVCKQRKICKSIKKTSMELLN